MLFLMERICKEINLLLLKALHLILRYTYGSQGCCCNGGDSLRKSNNGILATRNRRSSRVAVSTSFANEAAEALPAESEAMEAHPLYLGSRVIQQSLYNNGAGFNVLFKTDVTTSILPLLP